MAINTALTLLKATADPSRLRLLSLLAAGEATVGELVDVLGQSQPRVSRHLKILAEAGLVSHFRDGQWVYYRLESGAVGRELLTGIVDLTQAQDTVIAGDRERMTGIRRRRERYAFAAPTGPMRPVDLMGERPDEMALNRALTDALGEGKLGDVLDIGVGSGALLQVLAPRARSAVGLDIARGMRVLARSRLQQAGLGQCTIRAGDMHALPFPDLVFDVVILDEVLSRSPEPQRALAQALRVLRPSGHLLILDRIRPAALQLSGQAGRHALFENQLTVMLRGLGLKTSNPVWFPGRAMDYALITAAVAVPQKRTGTDE
jgi:DNA-binding transcriptional ArsR family regulator/protein-L-isoaspartate O-methyltransferase